MSAQLLKTYSVPQGLTVNMKARDQGLTPSLSFLCDLEHIMDTSKLQLSHLKKKMKIIKVLNPIGWLCGLNGIHSDRSQYIPISLGLRGSW